MRNKNIFGIDLLKSIAIISILIYHINVLWLNGGFIGVDLFFVISGYLLTSSIVRQYKKDNDISIGKNIIKRIKQLWPVLFIVVFVTTIYLTIFNKPVLDVAHKDIIPSLTFTNNIWFIVNKVGYFDSFIKSPFKHLWYISTLMQSYIIIIIFSKISVQSKKNPFKLYKILLIIFITISFSLSQIFYDIDNVSRVYYGIDTRFYEIAIGALFYLYFPIENLRKNTENNYSNNLIKNVQKYSWIISIISLAIYIWGLIYVNETMEWVYRFGFLLFSINSLLMIVSIGNDNNKLFSIFRYLPFLRSFGVMSYSIYLWHFPIIVLSQTQFDNESPNILLTILRVIVTLILSFLTYSRFEKSHKISSKSRSRTVRERNRLKARKNSFSLKVIYLLTSFLFALGIFGIAVPYVSTAFVNTEDSFKLPEEIITSENEQIDIEGAEILNEKIETEAEESKQSQEKKDNEEVKKVEENETKKEENELNNTEKETVKETSNEENSQNQNGEIKYKNVILIGDSLGVNVGAALKKQIPNAIIDAKVSRQLYKSKDVVDSYAKYNSKDTALIIMLGTNGTFSEKHLENLVSSFGDSKKIFVNVKVPEVWESEVNKRLADYTQNHENSSLVDWYSASKGHSEYFAPDKTHLKNDGIKVLLNLIMNELKN